MNKVYQIQDGISVTELKGEYMLFPNIFNEEYGPYVCMLNPVGYFVFSCIDGKKTLEEIAVMVSEQFRVEMDTVRKDVSCYLTRMEQKGIIIGV